MKSEAKIAETDFAIVQARFVSGDFVLMIVEDNGVFALKRFQIEDRKDRFPNDAARRAWEYQLRDMNGVRYKPDQWFGEGLLRASHERK